MVCTLGAWAEEEVAEEVAAAVAACWARARCGDGEDGVDGEVFACGFCAAAINKSIIACAISGTKMNESLHVPTEMNKWRVGHTFQISDLALVFLLPGTTAA